MKSSLFRSEILLKIYSEVFLKHFIYIYIIKLLSKIYFFDGCKKPLQYKNRIIQCFFSRTAYRFKDQFFFELFFSLLSMCFLCLTMLISSYLFQTYTKADIVKSQFLDYFRTKMSPLCGKLQSCSKWLEQRVNFSSPLKYREERAWQGECNTLSCPRKIT